MGAAANGQCHATALQAALAVCTEQYPRTLSDGSSLACTDAAAGPDPAGAVLSLALHDTVGGGPTTTRELALSFPDCDPLERITDLGQLWGISLAAIAIVWCAKVFVLRLVTDR